MTSKSKMNNVSAVDNTCYTDQYTRKLRVLLITRYRSLWDEEKIHGQTDTRKNENEIRKGKTR